MAATSLYFERQQAALCGVHALNNLCQGPYFTVGELADVAQELDQRERELMLSMGVDTSDAIRFIAEDSGNVSPSGNFSLQVLRQVFSKKFSLELIDSKHEKADSLDNAATKQSGFLCNLRDHWFALRRVGDTWWNLNSLLDRPQKLGNYYLGAYLAQLQQEQWRIFVVKGKLPPQALGHSPQHWQRVEDLLRKPARAAPKARRANQDLDLALALSRSLAETSAASSSSTQPEPAPTATAPTSATPPSAQVDDCSHHAVNDDADLAAAIAMSLQDTTPPSPPDLTPPTPPAISASPPTTAVAASDTATDDNA